MINADGKNDRTNSHTFKMKLFLKILFWKIEPHFLFENEEDIIKILE